MIRNLSRRNYWSNIYRLKSEIDRLLLLSVFFSSLLLTARICYTGRLTFVFLEWNLFLAFVPYVISKQLLQNPEWVINKFKFSLVFLIWLLFIPNSFYIITDLFHLHKSSGVPLWFDLMLLLSFAWNGLLMGILSVRQMEKIIQALWLPKNELLFVYPIMALNALGVYIGRYLRFNSWDIISNPFQLIADIFDLLIHPIIYKNAWGMIICFSFFMTLIYLTIKKISKVSW